MQSKAVPLEVHVIYIYTKTGIFGRNKQLVGPDVTGKLHVSKIDDPYQFILCVNVLCTLDLAHTDCLFV